MRSPAANAELALLLEAAAAPTPGNVDRERDHDTLRLEHFLAGAAGARSGLAMAADGVPLGDAFETAVAGMADQSGGNTQFGALLLLCPLVRTATDGAVTPASARTVVENTTVEDAAGFYRAFEHVDVRVEDPPESFEPLDVRRGVDAIPALRERGLTLFDVLAASADHDGVAREWTNRFERTFRAASLLALPDGNTTIGAADEPKPVIDWLANADGVLEHASRVHLLLLSEQPDSLITTAHDEATAESVRERAEKLCPQNGAPPSLDARREFATDLIDRGINPGMTADHLAAGLFIALERHVITV